MKKQAIWLLGHLTNYFVFASWLTFVPITSLGSASNHNKSKPLKNQRRKIVQRSVFATKTNGKTVIGRHLFLNIEMSIDHCGHPHFCFLEANETFVFVSITSCQENPGAVQIIQFQKYYKTAHLCIKTILFVAFA